jgi:hypothetical protein
MTEAVRQIVWQQLGAAFEMLENAVPACPDELWRRPSAGMGYWYLAYHTLFILDHDLTPANVEFVSPAFDVHEYEMTNAAPPYEHPYTADEILDYLRSCRRKCMETVAALRNGDRSLLGCERIDADVMEVLLYHLRHIQHHAAQLNARLSEATGSAPHWVRKSSAALDT